jgi:hypothetical protein
LPNIGNIINIFRIYINVTRQIKLRGSQGRDDDCSTKKNENGSSGMNSLDKETELLRRKIEEEKARKRTRGPYRKSHVN